MVRYYDWYSNRVRGERRKAAKPATTIDQPAVPEEIEVLDVSSYQPRRVPSKTWTDRIKKIWEADPLECPRCHAEMKIISFITQSQPDVIRRILTHLALWEEQTRPPPSKR